MDMKMDPAANEMIMDSMDSIRGIISSRVISPVGRTLHAGISEQLIRLHGSEMLMMSQHARGMLYTFIVRKQMHPDYNG